MRVTERRPLLPHYGFPRDLVYGSGNLYVSDYGNSTVRKITSSGTISTVAGTGIWGYSGDGGPGAKAALASPVAIAFDAAGNLYIGDYGNSTIRKIGTDGNIHTLASGVNPQSVAVDSAGDVFFVDGVNPVVKAVLPSGSSRPSPVPGNPALEATAATLWMHDWTSPAASPWMPPGTYTLRTQTMT